MGNQIIQAAPLPAGAVAPGAYTDPAINFAWLRAKAADDAYHANEQRKADYLTKFRAWFLTYDAGRDRSTPPPQPPLRLAASVSEQALSDGGFAFDATLIEVGMPVCEVPPYQKLPGDPAIPPPTAPPVPVYEVGDVTNADNPAIDGLPVGYKMSAPDESFGAKPDATMTWVKKVRRLPFGTAYFWQRVA